jgi:hypothetical protein
MATEAAEKRGEGSGGDAATTERGAWGLDEEGKRIERSAQSSGGNRQQSRRREKQWTEKPLKQSNDRLEVRLASHAVANTNQ